MDSVILDKRLSTRESVLILDKGSVGRIIETSQKVLNTDDNENCV